MMGPGPEFKITSFKVMGLVVPEKKIIEGFFTVYRRGGHLAFFVA